MFLKLKIESAFGLSPIGLTYNIGRAEVTCQFHLFALHSHTSGSEKHLTFGIVDMS